MVKTFGCGEYLPGNPREIPPGGGGGGNPGGGGSRLITGGYMGGAGGGGGGGLPGIPRGGKSGTFWKCYESPPYSICTGNQIVVQFQIDRECILCDEQEIIAESRLPQKDRKCTHSSRAICIGVCESQPGRC